MRISDWSSDVCSSDLLEWRIYRYEEASHRPGCCRCPAGGGGHRHLPHPAGQLQGRDPGPREGSDRSRPAHRRRHLAWVLWGLVHIYLLIGFRNRTAVFVNWMWSWFTYGRGARLITGPDRKSTRLNSSHS